LRQCGLSGAAGRTGVARGAHDHDCIAFEGLQTYRNWPVGGGGARAVPIRTRFSVNTADAVVEAAAAGLGIARVMSYQAANAISDRRVTTILRGFSPDPIPVSLVHQPQRIQPLKLRAFLNFVLPRLTLTLACVDEASSPAAASDNSSTRRP